MKRTFDRLPFQPDPRDDSYTGERLAAMIELGLAAPVTWSNRNRVLDQGQTGQCVAFGTLGLLNTDDENHNNPGFASADAHRFFATIPGAGPNGAEVRNGLKAAKSAGFISAYALLRTEREVDDWLRSHGPVLVGSIWTEGMCEPKDGLVRVDRTLSPGLPGHCYFWHGADTYYREGTNSWGEDWGERGLFRVRRADASRLHAHGGEAWAVVQDPVPERQAQASWWAAIMDWLRRTR